MDDLDFLHKTFNNNGPYNLSGLETPILVVVEDDQVLGQTLKKYIERLHQIECHIYTNCESCLENIGDVVGTRGFCLVTDISLGPGIDGLSMIDLLKQRGFIFESLAITGFGSIENAISATKKGVHKYLTKPFEMEKLVDLILEVFEQKLKHPVSKGGPAQLPTPEKKSAKDFIRKYKIEMPSEDDIFCGIIGRSASMRSLFNRIKKVADCDSTVLVQGPSGTGKELIANAIHSLSSRTNETLVSVNCGAIPSELLESELFGHVKGSFTGAVSDRSGKFEKSDKGTLFLDEIGDMPLLLQVKLLRVLQSRQIEPVGSNQLKDIDVRIITATHRDLESLVEEGLFRQDLFYRLNVIPIRIPALKDRREDIPLLIGHFCKKFVSADQSNAIEFSDEALELIMSYDWPGNVRELENLIERLVILRGGHYIRPEDLPPKIYRANPLANTFYKKIFELPEEGLDLKKVLGDIEDSLILQALDRTKGNKNQASKILQLNRTTLIEKMKKRGLGGFELPPN